LPAGAQFTRLNCVTGPPNDPIEETPDNRSSWTRQPRLAKARAAFTRGLRTLLAPDGLPTGAAVELEAAFGDIGREVLAAGPGRMGRVRAQVAAVPPRMLDWMSTQVIEHPAVLYDITGVEELCARQNRSIGAAVGALQLALLAAASASTFEGGPILAVAIDGVVGQVAAVVHGVCDWYNTGSYVHRRLEHLGITADVAEVRRLTNAALMSRGKTIDEQKLRGATEARLIRRWAGHGIVDALPFGSSLGKASVKAAHRIDHSDLVALLAVLRSES